MAVLECPAQFGGQSGQLYPARQLRSRRVHGLRNVGLVTFADYIQEEGPKNTQIYIDILIMEMKMA